MTDENRLYLLIACVECQFDPELSLKRVEKKIETLKESGKTPGKAEQYQKVLYRMLDEKLSIELMDWQIPEVLVLFLMKHVISG
jgi:hypothetical protein